MSRRLGKRAKLGIPAPADSMVEAIIAIHGSGISVGSGYDWVWPTDFDVKAPPSTAKNYTLPFEFDTVGGGTTKIVFWTQQMIDLRPTTQQIVGMQWLETAIGGAAQGWGTTSLVGTVKEVVVYTANDYNPKGGNNVGTLKVFVKAIADLDNSEFGIVGVGYHDEHIQERTMLLGFATSKAVDCTRAYMNNATHSIGLITWYMGVNANVVNRRRELGNSLDQQAQCCSHQLPFSASNQVLKMTDCLAMGIEGTNRTCDTIMQVYCLANPDDIKCACLKPKINPANLGRPECTNPVCVTSGVSYHPTDMETESCVIVCNKLVDLANQNQDFGLTRQQFNQVCPDQKLPPLVSGPPVPTKPTTPPVVPVPVQPTLPPSVPSPAPLSLPKKLAVVASLVGMVLVLRWSLNQWPLSQKPTPSK